MLSRLRKDMMFAKKEKNSVKANLLSTLIAEAVMVGKNDGNRETTEEEVLKTVKKFVKSIDETIKLLKEEGKEYTKEEAEKAVLMEYLPAQLSEEELVKAVDEIVAALPEKSPKMMGMVMGELKKRFDGNYDGKTASRIAKEKLAG